MKKVLYVDANVRKMSRTRILAETLLEKLGGDVEKVTLLDIDFPVADEEFITRRSEMTSAGNFDDPMFDLAKQFAAADEIVVAAPYWDLSFPAALKIYFEQINALGITFEYTDDGYPRGLCKAKKLYYVTTAGGSYVPYEFGYGYVKALANEFYGIKDTVLIEASGLDIWGADPEKIVSDAVEMIRSTY